MLTFDPTTRLFTPSMTNFDPVLISLENMLLMEAVWVPSRWAWGVAAIFVYALGGEGINSRD